MKNPLQTFEPNLLGRDIVIGDLHGAISCLATLLEGLKFDPTKDRLFSVGDLIDRGEDSRAALDLLYENWFHCVLANHEQMALDAYLDDTGIGQYWMPNGGSWAMSDWLEFMTWRDNKAPMSDPAIQLMDALVEKVAELPYLITINHKNGKKFHIVHAELPYFMVAEPITDRMLEDPAKVRAMGKMQYRLNEDSMCWARHLFGAFYMFDVARMDKMKRIVQNNRHHLEKIFTPSLSHVISGHTIVQKPITLVGQTCIDTRAFSADEKPWCALTAIVLDDWTFWQATKTEFRSVDPIVLNIETPAYPGAFDNADDSESSFA